MFDVFWVLFGVVFLGGGIFWPQVSTMSVRARVAWRIWCIYTNMQHEYKEKLPVSETLC